MRLKELNLNKLIGREAILNNRWSVDTYAGEQHEIRVSLTSGLVGARLSVELAMAPENKRLLEKRVMILAGKLAQFELGGDIFTVHHSGLGFLGRLSLYQNGRDISENVVTKSREKGNRPQEQIGSAEDWETWIEESSRVSEPLGDDVRIIDNSQSGSSTERKITVSRQWTQTVSLDMEKAMDMGGSVNVKLPFSLGFDASAKKSISRKYAVSEEVTRTYSEEVTIKVLPKTRSKITFMWRQVWQRGTVVGRNASGTEVRVPFEVKLHPIFDQMQEDMNNEIST